MGVINSIYILYDINNNKYITVKVINIDEYFVYYYELPENIKGYCGISYFENNSELKGDSNENRL